MRLLQVRQIAFNLSGILLLFGSFCPVMASYINGVSVESVSSQYSTRLATYTIDSDLTFDPVAGTLTNDMRGWMSLGSEDFAPEIIYDLGAVYSLKSIHIWNWNQAPVGFTVNGAKDITISVAGENLVYSAPTSFILEQAPAINGYTGQELAIGATGVRYVKINIQSSFLAGSFFDRGASLNWYNDVGLGKVMFTAGYITGVSVESVSSQYSTRLATYTIDSDSTFDPVAGTLTNDMRGWMSLGSEDFAPEIVYDLGAVYSLKSIHIWNWNQAPVGFTVNGAKDITISVAGEDQVYSNSMPFVLEQATATNGYTGQNITVDASNVRYVKINIQSTFQAESFFDRGASLNWYNDAGLAKVMFLGSQNLMIEPFEYASGTAAQAVWTESDAGGNVTPVVISNRNVLSFPYTFTSSTASASWERSGSWDMSQYTHLRFRINGASTAGEFKHLSVHFESGNGGWWDYDNIYLLDHWQTIILPLANFTANGTPVNWSDIISIKITAWQNGTETGSFALSDMQAVQFASANKVYNSGFEVSTIDDLPDYWTSSSFALYYVPWVVDTALWRSYWRVDNTVSHSGQNSLCITCPGVTNQLELYSQYLTMKADKKYTYSVWLKANQSNYPVDIKVVDSATYTAIAQSSVTVGTEWTRFSLSNLSVSSQISAFVSVVPGGIGTFWVDDIQFEENIVATDFKYSPLDEHIDTDVIERSLADISDFQYSAGSSTVSVSIDANRRFLVDGEPFIPIAMNWNIPSLEVLQEMAKAGFNSIVLNAHSWQTVSSLRTTLDDARSCGLKVIFYADGPTSQVLEDWINSLKDHSAIIAWYVYDEPITAAQWQEAEDKYNIAKAADPSRPVYVNFSQLPTSTSWTGDILSCDDYQIPMRSPITMTHFVDALENLAAPSGKPVWMWQQGVGYANFLGREPTAQEAQCMAYLSIIHGARGLMYWIWKPRTIGLWREMRMLTREIRTLTPILSSTETPLSVTSSSPAIHVTSKRYNGHDYIIAVNTSPEVVYFVDLQLSTSSTTATDMFYPRTLNVVNGTITDVFDKYHRHVYRLE